MLLRVLSLLLQHSFLSFANLLTENIIYFAYQIFKLGL